MHFVTSSKMRQIEEAMFADGVDAWDLMQQAGRGVAREIMDFLPEPGVALVYAGKGNNGGDAWVAAEELLDQGWEVRAAGVVEPGDMSPLCRRAWDAVARRIHTGKYGGRVDLLVDGLLGTGSKGALRGKIREWCEAINHQRQQDHAVVCAIDLPTGLDGDSGEVDPAAVHADLTVALGLPKHGLVADAAVMHVGVLRVVDLGMNSEEAREITLACPASLSPLMIRREHAAHKGDCGRLGIVAGSKGFVGAAVLCAAGALRGGAGLVTLWVPDEIYEIAAIKTAPEIMVAPWSKAESILQSRMDALVLGPGIGRGMEGEVKKILQQWKAPMVLDADGLNLLAADGALRESVAADWILTPHEGEMERLLKRRENESRADWAGRFREGNVAVLLLKGPRTMVAGADGRISYNSSGNSGMASGGMGDVLAGVIGALVVQGYASFDAARLGAWLTGRAAELLVASGARSIESLLASDVAEALGGAFGGLQRG